ncbi:uncharacterized protein LOC119074049 [Bradysia coprophila]|uniref:uncharacterized protein LOC119074049 n=1 Tax=Bradysia coprophila TaxID=38358 RepID=UPI00187DA1F5|nr:uncharacterized protein LOC119074049 [Bradysia coprophila]
MTFSQTQTMDSSEPKTITDLSLEQLKMIFAGKISPRRLACVREKYDLLKYLWKESEIEDTGCNEYAKQRLADMITPMRRRTTCHTVPSSADRFEENKSKIQNLVRSAVGNKWWQFGKHLYIKQGQLDTIGTEENTVVRKVNRVFEAFEQNCYNEVAYVNAVSKALHGCRLTDLATEIYRIVEH